MRTRPYADSQMCVYVRLAAYLRGNESHPSPDGSDGRDTLTSTAIQDAPCHNDPAGTHPRIGSLSLSFSRKYDRLKEERVAAHSSCGKTMNQKRLLSGNAQEMCLISAV